IDGIVSAVESEAALRASEETPSYSSMSERQLGREIKRLEKQMLEFAKNLQFEKAAEFRDQLAVLRERVFGSGMEERSALAEKAD
ncbi:MAG TPA: UvrB/UvrC motif-containing protein, partial [Burkholderiaceae bacterium]|nr:UvrB/UvrC motif-containing protein [Burkholderiaceae bacterium]